MLLAQKLLLILITSCYITFFFVKFNYENIQNYFLKHWAKYITVSVLLFFTLYIDLTIQKMSIDMLVIVTLILISFIICGLFIMGSKTNIVSLYSKALMIAVIVVIMFHLFAVLKELATSVYHQITESPEITSLTS